MKTTIHILALSVLLSLTAWPVAAADRDEQKPKETKSSRSASASASASAEKEVNGQKRVVVKVLGDHDDDSAPAKDRAWLGLAAEEASEALGEQLGLDPGVGLVVTHLSDDSPAAKAGLKKNDVLIELAGQALVHPAQLRKLVRARKPGEKVKLTFYRGGKKHTESATLEQTPARPGWSDSDLADVKLQVLQRKLLDLSDGEALRHARIVGESLRGIGEDLRRDLDPEIHRGMEETRKALAEAMRGLDQNKESLRTATAQLKELFKSGMGVDDNATIVVRSKGKSSRMTVKTDDSGTLIIAGPPNLHLTARDKSGKLIFEGEIETADQRAQVPADVWKRVERLLDEPAPALAP